MLALTRKVGEKIIIGSNIVITLADIRGDNVRLAIDAPREIKIYRGEIYDAIATENKKAAESAGLDALDLLGNIQVNPSAGNKK